MSQIFLIAIQNNTTASTETGKANSYKIDSGLPT